MAESEKKLKDLLMKVKEEREKSWFETQHSKKENHHSEIKKLVPSLHGKQMEEKWKQ